MKKIMKKIINREWRLLKSLNNKYEVSNFGEVRSVERKVYYKNGTYRIYPSKLLTPQALNGYFYVVVSINKIRYNKLIHRLVAEAFIPNPNNYPEVNHIDENKSHNFVSNLEWCDKVHNMNHGSINGRLAFTKYRKNR